MSGLEIERKLLVKEGDAFKSAAFSRTHVQQGYIPCQGCTIRVRIRDQKAYLTIKGRPRAGGFARYEFEKEIEVEEARQLLRFCRGGIIDKHRYLVNSGAHVFEIDEFHGENEGLLLAEVELQDEEEDFIKPDFIGKEVTGDHRFHNTSLLTNPFCRWREELEK